MTNSESLSQTELVSAIRRIQDNIIWKPGSAEQHVKQRIRRGHLPATATLVEYEGIIQTIIHSATTRVYIFWYHGIPYVSIIDDVNENQWLVMFALNGIMESAYIVERPERYLNKPEFEYVDLLSKVIPHDDE